MRWLTIAGYLALAGAAVLIGMRFAPSQSWFPAAQVVGFFPVALPLALLALALLAIARERWGAVAAAALSVVMLGSISLRVVHSVQPFPAGPAIGVGAVNAYFGRADAEALTDAVREHSLDVLCVSEATPQFEAALAEAGLTAYLPSFISMSEGGASGTVLFSRLPIREIDPVPGSQFRMPRAVLDLPGDPVTVTCAHPVPPTPRQLGTWSRELRAIRDTVARTDGPQIVLGDFNATWDHRLLRKIADRGGLTHAANVTGNGLTPTWPVIDGPLPVPFVAIDHVLTDLPVFGTDVIDIPGSDHRMVTARLRVSPPPGSG